MTRCGFIAILGRPNVGKSSLVNAILKQKVSITSFRPQTTRQQIMGIKTQDNLQAIYVDTPGIHLGEKKLFNKQMNKAAKRSLIDVDVAVFMVEALKWTPEDQHVLECIQTVNSPVIVLINKIDLIEDKDALLSFMVKINESLPKATIIPISVKKRTQLEEVEELVTSYLPEGPFYFPAEQTTNYPEKFHVAEVIREKLIKMLDNELPYSLCVEVETLEREDNLIRINALIWVEREGQKAIVIGDKGQMLKEIGTQARLYLEKYFNQKVFLKLWVKAKPWSNSLQELKNLGLYEN